MKRVLAAAVSLCFVSLLHAQVDAKLADAVKHAKVSLDAGLKDALVECGYADGDLELGLALKAALDRPNTAERWQISRTSAP